MSLKDLQSKGPSWSGFLQDIDQLARQLPSLESLYTKELEPKWTSRAIVTVRIPIATTHGAKEYEKRTTPAPQYIEIISDLDQGLGKLPEYDTPIEEHKTAYLKYHLESLLLNNKDSSLARKMLLDPQYRRLFIKLCQNTERIHLTGEQAREKFWKNIKNISLLPEYRDKTSIFGQRILYRNFYKTTTTDRRTNQFSKLDVFCAERAVLSPFSKVFSTYFSPACMIPQEFWDYLDSKLPAMDNLSNMVTLRNQGRLLLDKKFSSLNYLKKGEREALLALLEEKTLYVGDSAKKWRMLKTTPEEAFYRSLSILRGNKAYQDRFSSTFAHLYDITDQITIYPQLRSKRRKDKASVAKKSLAKNSISYAEIIECIPEFALKGSGEKLLREFFIANRNGTFYLQATSAKELQYLKEKARRQNLAGFAKLINKINRRTISKITDLLGDTDIVLGYDDLNNLFNMIYAIVGENNLLEIETRFIPPQDPMLIDSKYARNGHKPYMGLHLIIKLDGDTIYEKQLQTIVDFIFKNIEQNIGYKNETSTTAAALMHSMWWKLQLLLSQEFIVKHGLQLTTATVYQEPH